MAVVRGVRSSSAKKPSASSVSNTVALCGAPVLCQRSMTVRPRPGPGPRSTVTAQSRVVNRSGRISQAIAHGSCSARAGAAEARAQRHGRLDVAQRRACSVPCRPARMRRQQRRRAQRLRGQFECRQHDRSAAREQHGECLGVVQRIEFRGRRCVAFAPGAGHQHNPLDLLGERRLGHQREREVGRRRDADQRHRLLLASRRMSRMASAATPARRPAPPAGSAMPPRPSTPCTRVSLTKAPSSGRSAPA